MSGLAAILCAALAVLAGCDPDLPNPDGGPPGDGGADAGALSGHPFSDARLFPEGGAYDPVGRAFYVGSLSHGNITRVDATGQESVWFAGSGEAQRYTLGMQVDATRRLLWVCTTLNSLGRIWVFELESGTRRSDLNLTGAFATASCNDLVLDGDGSALVTDRENPIIYRVDAAAQHATLWARHALLESSFIHLNGIVLTPDGSAVLTATYSPASLVRIARSDPTDVRAVALSGDPFAAAANHVFDGADDLAFQGADLIVAFGTSIMRLTPSDASWASATVVSTPSSIGGVTALVPAEGELFAINGQAVSFVVGSAAPEPFQIFRPVYQ